MKDHSTTCPTCKNSGTITRMIEYKLKDRHDLVYWICSENPEHWEPASPDVTPKRVIPIQLWRFIGLSLTMAWRLRQVDAIAHTLVEPFERELAFLTCRQIEGDRVTASNIPCYMLIEEDILELIVNLDREDPTPAILSKLSSDLTEYIPWGDGAEGLIEDSGLGPRPEEEMGQVDYEALEKLAPEFDRMGSVSSGTMRHEDLIPAFVGVLEEMADEDDKAFLAEVAKHQETPDYYETPEANYDLEELFDRLNNHAPEGVYFGSHPGDGADYGYWVDEDVEDGADQVSPILLPEGFSGLMLSVDANNDPLAMYRAEAGKITACLWRI